MPADPVVSPAATPDAATPSLPSGCGCDGNPAGGVCSYPDCQLPPPTTAELLGPVSAVSPADARVGDLELWALEASVEDIVALVRDRAALLAVGERDKAEIAALKAEVARLADRAVCSGCGQDVDEGGACHTPECHTGEMIPSSDLPGALLHLCEENAEEREEWRSDWEELRAEAKALEIAGERDRRQIAQLTEAVKEASERLGWMTRPPFVPGLTNQIAEVRDALRAVLADEEDAP